jgi:hypothetical protein
MLGSNTGEQKLVPVVVPENHINRAAEAAGDLSLLRLCGQQKLGNYPNRDEQDTDKETKL